MALVVQRGVNFAQPTEHPVGTKVGDQRIDMPHAIQDRHDQRMQTDSPRNVLDGLIQTGALTVMMIKS